MLAITSFNLAVANAAPVSLPGPPPVPAEATEDSAALEAACALSIASRTALETSANCCGVPSAASETAALSLATSLVKG